MILREATLKYKGYDTEELSKFSHKRVCVSCNICGRVRYIQYYQYRDLCKPCSKNGEKIILICKICKKKYDVTPAFKDKLFCSKKCRGKWTSINKFGKNAPNWKGGLSLRDHVLSEYKCIKLNVRFNNSEFHHITKSIGIFIPKTLHRHFYHNLKTGQGIGEMNILAIQFMNGEL